MDTGVVGERKKPNSSEIDTPFILKYHMLKLS